MPSRLASLAVWALVAASLVFWGFTVAGPRTPLPDGARLPPPESLASGGWSRALGVPAVADAPDDEPALADEGRFQVLGVVAPRGAPQSAQGVALIAIDQQPARVVRTGAVVDGDVVLLGVNRRSAQLGPRGGPATVELTLPDPDTVTAASPASPVVRGSVAAPAVAMPHPAARPMGAAAAMAGQGAVAAPVHPQPAATEPDMSDEEE